MIICLDFKIYPEWDTLIDEFSSYTDAANTEYIYMKPILFMQILAGVASSNINFNKYMFAFDGLLPLPNDYVPGFYNYATSYMALFSMNSGYMKPHYVDAYAILCEKR
jgi:hypothetical protein